MERYLDFEKLSRYVTIEGWYGDDKTNTFEFEICREWINVKKHYAHGHLCLKDQEKFHLGYIQNKKGDYKEQTLKIGIFVCKKDDCETNEDKINDYLTNIYFRYVFY